MEKETTRKFKWGFTWELEKLEKWMSDLSAKGMHIDKPGNLWNRYTTDPSIQYIYRIDFQQDLLDKDKLNEYTSLYADSGWEYVGSVGPLWHYFRKNAFSEEPFELYTDRSSLADYYKRISKVLVLVALINLLSIALNISLVFPKYFTANLWSITIPVVSIQMLLFLFLIYGYFRFSQKIKVLAENK
ncbi:DUF2812 domain-containing protein [Paenibacillus psychroresistens]|uniref:DUF2812 domain-containing protein n=1 Tax=Paenibacillus psychroresistens TaxID=1778678 RepID=A0A6B8RG37_9BACL|nr:DUF2812 domain-containing protein [Paenibacillus psychroresistens]QGQ94694.1 DUF2812 domain-containing protein [Paenibacillus psychroresistens]